MVIVVVPLMLVVAGADAVRRPVAPDWTIRAPGRVRWVAATDTGRRCGGVLCAMDAGVFFVNDGGEFSQVFEGAAERVASAAGTILFDRHAIAALDRATPPEVRWRFSEDLLDARTYRGDPEVLPCWLHVAEVGGRIIAINQDGRVVWLERATGAVIARHELGPLPATRFASNDACAALVFRRGGESHAVLLDPVQAAAAPSVTALRDDWPVSMAMVDDALVALVPGERLRWLMLAPGAAPRWCEMSPASEAQATDDPSPKRERGACDHGAPPSRGPAPRSRVGLGSRGPAPRSRVGLGWCGLGRRGHEGQELLVAIAEAGGVAAFDLEQNQRRWRVETHSAADDPVQLRASGGCVVAESRHALIVIDGRAGSVSTRSDGERAGWSIRGDSLDVLRRAADHWTVETQPLSASAPRPRRWTLSRPADTHDPPHVDHVAWFDRGVAIVSGAWISRYNFKDCDAP